MSLLKRHLGLGRRLETDPLADMPLMPGGCLALKDHALEAPSRTLAMLLSASQRYSSRHPGGDAIFLLGLQSDIQAEHFPEARPIEPAPVLDGLVLSPGTYALILRMLFGEGDLLKYQNDLLLLEMLGMQAPKPIPLPLFAEWVGEQLAPESLVRALTHPMGDEQAAGAAFKALMMHPSFSFGILDDLPSVAERLEVGKGSSEGTKATPVTGKARDVIAEWCRHAETVKAMAERMVQEPPEELFFLAEMRRCIEAGGSWVVPDGMAAKVAGSLHVMGMANGLRERHHWYIDLSHDCMQESRSEIQRSLERFAFQLWQQEEARQNGFGPSLWCNYDAPGTGHAPRRLLHGTQATLASLDALSPLLQEDREKRGIDASGTEPGGRQQEDDLDPRRLGLFEARTGQFRHLHDREIAALAPPPASAEPSRLEALRRLWA